jgi:phosphoglycolate phosphatase
MIRCVVFDFDGTLLLSNDIKREGFFAAVAEQPGGVERMARILASPPGDRYAIFRRFADEAGDDPGELAVRYSSWCEERILVCPERSGASLALAELRRAGIRVHVNSATPTIPLRSVVLRRYGEGRFDGVHGGHGAKRENLEAILRQEQLVPSSLAMVGDGIDDREAALAVGCQFIGIGGGTLAATAPAEELLDSLECLWPLLRDETAREMQA